MQSRACQAGGTPAALTHRRRHAAYASDFAHAMLGLCARHSACRYHAISSPQVDEPGAQADVGGTAQHRERDAREEQAKVEGVLEGEMTKGADGQGKYWAGGRNAAFSVCLTRMNSISR